VAASITTQHLLRTEPDDAPIDNDNEAANPTNPTSTDEDQDDGAAMEDAFSGLSMNDELLEDDYCNLEKSGEGIFSTPERRRGRRTVPQARRRKRLFIPPIGPQSRHLRPILGPLPWWNHPSHRSPLQASPEEKTGQKNPCVVFVDPTRPERNREFDIERVCKIKHNGYEYNGYHVRTPIAVPDYNNWEAHVPTELPRHFRGKYIRRALLVKGPAQSFWIRNQERYHKKLTCAQTVDSHSRTHLEIEADPTSFYMWYLLLWVNCVILDNHVFSSHPTEVEKKLVPLEVGISNDDNETGKLLYGMAVFWRIAKKYGSCQVEDTKKKVDATKLFD
jgi:hypothetical protein